MGKWIKQNLVLLIGILLPVLLVGGFFVMSHIPRLLAEPPMLDFLLVAYRYDNQNQRDFHLSFEVRDGKLNGSVIPKGQGNANYNRQYAAIFRYKAKDNSFDEIPYELPDGLQAIEESISFLIDETNDLKLDKSKQSPDGYSFEYRGYSGRGGLLGEIFGMGHRYQSNYVLNNNGAYVNLPKPGANPYYYQHDLHFMGWVIEEGSAP